MFLVLPLGCYVAVGNGFPRLLSIRVFLLRSRSSRASSPLHALSLFLPSTGPLEIPSFLHFAQLSHRPFIYPSPFCFSQLFPPPLTNINSNSSLQNRPSYPRPAPSSWMSNAQAVSPSRPSSRTRRRSSSAVAAPPCSVSPPVARPG